MLTTKDMRAKIIKLTESQQIDVNIKYVDSYFQAAKLINDNEFEPYDYIILNLSLNNKKLQDFVEFAHEKYEQHPNFLIEYTKAGNLDAVHIEVDND